MFSRIITFALFAVFAASVIYNLYISYWLFPYLEKKYPEYYKEAGRPLHGSGSLRRQGLANDIIMKLMFGYTPKGFPHDELIVDRINNLQLVWLVVTLPSWIGVIVISWVDMYNY